MTDGERDPERIDALRSLRRDVEPPPGLEERTLAAARAARAAGAQRPRLAPLLAAASVAIAFLAGLATGRWTAPVPSADASARYLLLLEETAAYRQPPPGGMPERVAEYRAWAEELEAEGRLVMARQLDERALRVPVDRSAEDARITGLFIVDAGSVEEAVATARASPHTAYGGTVLVRPIRSTATEEDR